MARSRVPGEWPPVTSVYNPDDYTADDVEGGTPAQRRACRGSIEYHQRWKNYSLHRVLIDLGGQARIIRDCNFTLSRILVRDSGSLEFRNCNLAGARWHSQDGATVTFTGGQQLQLAGE